MAMKHQTLSKCTFSSKHINFPLLSPFYCWGVMSYLAIIQPIQPLGLVSSKVPKIKDNTLAKADSMAPAMLRRYKIHPFRKALRPRPGGCFVLNWLVVSTPLKNISQNGNLPQVGVKMKNIGNHHPVNPWLWKILENFSARFMIILENHCGFAWEQCDPSWKNNDWRFQNLGTPWREAMRKWPLICGKSLDLRGTSSKGIQTKMKQHLPA